MPNRTQDAAKAAGQEYYWGRRCLRNHGVMRLTRTSECPLCVAENVYANQSANRAHRRTLPKYKDYQHTYQKGYRKSPEGLAKIRAANKSYLIRRDWNGDAEAYETHMSERNERIQMNKAIKAERAVRTRLREQRKNGK